MIDTAVLKEALAGYKEKFASELWHKGKYKWEAVKCFQDNWDVNAATDKHTYTDAATGETKETSAFAEMLARSLAGAKELLSSGSHAYAVIMALANIAPKEVRAIFQALYDDEGALVTRIKSFRGESEELVLKHASALAELGPASGEEQNEHALSVYLWLRFPDKYYVYTYSEARDIARLLKSGYKFTKGSSETNLANCYELYDEIREEIRQDEELKDLIKERLTDACYQDPELCTLTQDVGSYLSRDYKEKMTVKQELDLYDKAAARIKRYAETHTINYVTSAEEINAQLQSFQERFAPEVLEKLSDDALLKYIFLTGNGDKQSLCYCLEFDTKIRSIFGSIAGGASYKYGLFKGSDGKWMTGSPKNQKELTDEEALLEGKKIRDGLVSGCRRITERQLDTLADYEALDDDLHKIMGTLAGRAWVQKYFHLIFTDKFSPWYVANLLVHHLLGFGIEPSSKYYGMSGQLALVRRRTGYLAPHFGDVCYAIFGRLTRFFRLNLPEEEPQAAEHWQSESIVALGCGKTGDLARYLEKDSQGYGKLTSVLEKEYYDSDAKAAAKKAGELKAFYDANASTPRISDVLLVTQGKRLVAFVDQLDKYYFEDGTETAHRKKGQWHQVFAADEALPVDEGTGTSFCEIKKTENLLYLYKKYYRNEETVPPPVVSTKKAGLRYETGVSSGFARNRILFGAPGTGKSFTLNKDCEQLIGAANDNDYERVTFHPDYSYAHFVGTYKPVPAKDSEGRDSITYKFVPGPFMRVYVEALKNAMTEAPRPFLLIIEEINRANAAAVFGDVFQLLDRNDKNVSEYPIRASEDMKTYLASELKVHESQCQTIRIPDNMFIWATMNSADQGVFPMDTAFKRRWSFTYLGINDCDKLLQGKYVVLGSTKRQRVEWNKLRKAINHFLANRKINEDKQLGPYFVARGIAVPESGDEIDRDSFIDTFKNKVIMYLFEDAAKQKRMALFEGCADSGNSYSEICRKFEDEGINIFNKDIVKEAEPEYLPAAASAGTTQEA